VENSLWREEEVEDTRRRTSRSQSRRRRRRRGTTKGRPGTMRTRWWGVTDLL
jgi:hypothetical protein